MTLRLLKDRKASLTFVSNGYSRATGDLRKDNKFFKFLSSSNSYLCSNSKRH